MRNNFLCISIIIMLNTMLVKRCTCRFNDVRRSPWSGIMSTLVIVNKSKDLVADHVSLCDFTHEDNDTCKSFSSTRLNSTLLYTTVQSVQKTRKCVKRKTPTVNWLEDITREGAKKRHMSTVLSPPTIRNGSSSVLNFKIRKKPPGIHRVPSSIRSSHRINSWVITTQVSTWLSSMNYINSSDLQNRSQNLTRTVKKSGKKPISDLETNIVFTIEKLKRTRRKKPSSTCESNSTICYEGSSISRKSRRKLLSPMNKTSKRRKSKKNSIEEAVHGKGIVTSSTNCKRKLLRQELIELLRNQSLHRDKEVKKDLFAKPTFITVASITPIVQNTRSRILSSILPKTILFPPQAQNFLYSEESKVNVANLRNESILNEFDEIILNPVNSVAEKLDLQHSYEKILYIPRNNSVRRFAHFTTVNQLSTRVKCKTLRGKSTVKTKNQEVKLKKTLKQPSKTLVELVTRASSLKKDTTKKRLKLTHFDMYDFFLHQKPHQNALPEPKSTSGKNIIKQNRMPATKLILKGKSDLIWKQFLLSPEKNNINEEGPTVNVFSEIQEEDQVITSSETTYPPMVTLNFKDLPDTKECHQLWNLTLETSSDESIKANKSNEMCTLGSLEALHLVRQNFSGLLTTKSYLSELSPFHPLLHPFATKFDDSILPKAKEAKAIFAKYFNESIELNDDPDETKSEEYETTLCPLEQLNLFDFSDISLSYEWKLMFERARSTTQKYTDMTDLPIELPDTLEAESILHHHDWPNMFKTLASRQNQSPTGSPRISTLSLQESKLLFARLGVELFGQKFRININHRDQKNKHRILHSKTQNKIPERVLKNKKVERYVLDMITEMRPDSNDQEAYVPWESEESESAVMLNFDMKLFLSKLCTYLSTWKHKNETHELPASKKPHRSFLIGKPAYFKKRKNALI